MHITTIVLSCLRFDYTMWTTLYYHFYETARLILVSMAQLIACITIHVLIKVPNEHTTYAGNLIFTL